MKVGFVGVGRMGRGIAGRILGAGHELLVYNRTAAKTGDLAAAGATAAATAADACAGREVVVSMLADDAALAEVALARGGLRDSLPKGAIHLAMGTHGVGAIRELARAHAAAGQALVAAPVIGRPDIAAAGQLVVVASGAADAVRRCGPLLQVIGRRTVVVGEAPEAATAVKLANNFLIGCALEAMSEALSLVRKYDVAPQVFHDVISDGPIASTVAKVYGKIMVDESWDNAGFTTRLGLKDANLILAAGEAAGVPLPAAGILRDHLISAIAHGGAEKDWAVIAREQARASGLA